MQSRQLACLLTAVLGLACSAYGQESRQTLNFNPDWRFIKEDVAIAKDPAFDDSKWAVVSCPHTYNDVDTFDDFSLSGHRGEQNQWGGRTWYRKTFTAPAEWQGKKVFIEFEAVRQVADVYLNGEKLGTCKTGFTPFGFDLTPHLKVGGTNVLAVMVDNRFMKDPYEADGASKKASAKPASQPAGGLLQELQHEFNQSIPDKVEDLQPDQIPWNNPHWHPAHGGIYRDVELTVTDPLHIELPLYSFLQTAGPYVYATDVSEKAADVNVDVPVRNDRAEAADVQIGMEIFDRDGKSLGNIAQHTRIDAGARFDCHLAYHLNSPHLWEPAYPYLHKVVCTVKVGNQVVDSTALPLGIRTVRWDVDHGFFINGHHEKLHGWGQKPTDEWPGLGAAQPDWLHYFTLDLMKRAGGNWVRWGHCAAGRAQVDACDQLGLMVEQPGVDGESDTVKAAWDLRASAFRDVLIYFRNNPSIMIWEGGNQKVTADHAKQLRGLMETYDPHGGRAYAHRRSDKTTAQFEDVLVGTEGGREFPDKPVVEGEYDREESPRRVWDDQTPRPSSADPSKIVFGYPEAKGMTYDLTGEQFAVNEISHWLKKCGADNHAGGANWIFSDSTSGGRVPAEVDRAGGEVDAVRLPKEAYYVCKALFSGQPYTHIIGHWNYPSGTTKTVYVVSNAGAEIALVLNNKLVATARPGEGYLYTFPNVKFEPGILQVQTVGRQILVLDTLKTAGPAHHVKLTPITGPKGFRASGSDVALVDVEVVDADGNRCPTFYGPVAFSPSGPVTYRGGYNSGKEHTINQTTLDLECGINRISLRSTLQPGPVRLTATVPNLPPAILEFESKPFVVANGYSTELPGLPAQGEMTKPTGAAPLLPNTAAATESEVTGKLITGFSYTGPSKPVSIRPLKGEHLKVYSDADAEFTDLPSSLRSGEYLQLPNADHNYSALDLIQFTAARDLDLYVAHDDRLARPKWLATDFRDTGKKLTLAGTTATLFKRTVKKDASLTLGGNTDSQFTGPSDLYVVIAVPHKSKS